ncbi:MAG: glycoside hydrolase family 78 protein, partial [Prevotella sp.]|nr:glycoside hydrolase family 78 protein [Prevotella sp.]
MKTVRLTLFVALFVASSAIQATTEIKNLRVEYLKNPAGIDIPNPQFSWEMLSDVIGAKQTAYEIRLFVGDNETPFWDSGKIASDHSAGTAYDGSPLSPSTRYRWTVDVWDENDTKISPAETAFFETGLMSAGWSDAKWLKIKDKIQDNAPADFTLACDVTVIDQNAGVIFGAKDANNMYMWAINTYNMSHPVLRRHIFVNGSVTEVNDIPLPAQFTTSQIIGHERRLKIEAANNVVKTYIDDVLVDTYGNSALRNGYIGFRVYTGDNNTHEHAYIDNVVYNYTENGQLKTFTEDFENGSNDFEGVNTVLVNGNSKMNLQAQGNADLRVLQGAAQGIPMFRTEFSLAKSVKSARIYASALGVYDLFVNGQRVGMPQSGGTTVYDELKPGWTDYRKTVFYSTYDITGLLVTGANAVGAEVTSGWFTGNIAHNEYGQHPLAFIAKILLEYTDGTSETIVTAPATWKASADSPVRMADIYDGETYDARKECGWKTAGFDDSAWEATEINDYFTGDILAFIGQPVRVRSELEQTPKTIKVHNGITPTGTTYGTVNVVRTLNGANSFTLAKGETAIVDFGQNMVGWIDFKVTGSRGTKLTARFSEMLNDSGDESRGNDDAQGTLYLRNLRSAKATLRYTLKGDAQGETFHPSMTFFGFRYCEITATGDIALENLKGEVVGNANEENSAFVTNNDLVNKLYSNVQWGQRGNFLSVPTDCPQRDERLGWMGDTQIFSRAAAYNADVLPFFRKWAKDVRDSQQPDGTYPSVVPDNWNVGYGRTAWAEAGIIVPWNMYLMYGDSRLLDEHYASMEKFMDWMATRQFDGYLYNGGDTQYGDWLAYEATDARFISVCYYAYAAQLMTKIAAALDKTPDVAKYQTLYNNIKSEFQRRYLNSRNGTLTVSSQTSHLLALQYDLFPDSAKTQAALTVLTGKIQSNGNKLSTGFVGTGILNQTLSEYGANDVAYTLLLQRENPSWLYSVDQGATTIWERWNSYTIASGFGDPGMNSFNHYSYGAVSEWLFRFVAGIEASENTPGFKHFVLQPNPDTRSVSENELITTVSAEYGSYYGKIKSCWERKADGNYRYAVTVPANTTAT